MTLTETLHHRPRRWRRKPPRDDDIACICWLMETAVAAAFAVAVEELRAPSRRCAEAAFARQAAMYLAHVALGLSYGMVGRLFRRDRTTAAHACQMVEERRDDATIDHLLTMLELVCDDIAAGICLPPQVRP